MTPNQEPTTRPFTTKKVHSWLGCAESHDSERHEQYMLHNLTRLSPPVLQYMQFVEDYSEPQPSMFYQMPQSESIYEQRNKRFQEVYSFNDSFSSTDSVHEPLHPPALPPKQRQLVRDHLRPLVATVNFLKDQNPVILILGHLK